MSLKYDLDVENIRQRLEVAHNPIQAVIRGKFFEAEYGFFQKYVNNKNVLVAGSGLGHDAFEIAPYNKRVVGVELLSPLVKISQEECEKRNIENVHFEIGDFTNLTYQNDSFDVAILNMGTISNFEDKEMVVKELLRVAPTVYFDFYPPSSNTLATRKQLYTEELWKNVRVDGTTIISDDGLESVSLPQKDVDNIVSNLEAKVKYYPITEYSLMAEVKRS